MGEGDLVSPKHRRSILDRMIQDREGKLVNCVTNFVPSKMMAVGGDRYFLIKEAHEKASGEIKFIGISANFIKYDLIHNKFEVIYEPVDNVYDESNLGKTEYKRIVELWRNRK